MNIPFWLSCFLVGMAASSSLGPIFVLTFNRGALRGFFAGVLTGLGSAVADAFYFYLGLIGVLTALRDCPIVMKVFHVVGGIALMAIGATMMYRQYLATMQEKDDIKSYGAMISQGFAITFVNPMVLLFFMMISMKLLSWYPEVAFTSSNITFYAVVLCVGSLTVFACISLLGKALGRVISMRSLRVMRVFISVSLIVVGLYIFVSIRCVGA